MMRSIHAVAGAVAVAAATSPAQAALSPQMWTKVGEWEVRPSNVGKCSVSRVYPGGSEVAISSDRRGYAVLSLRNRAWFKRSGPYTMRLVRAGQVRDFAAPPQPHSLGLSRSAEAGRGLLAQLAAGGAVEVADSNGALIERVDLGDVGPALAQLGPCMTEAATAANFPPPPPPPPPRAARPPSPIVPIHRLFSDGDYPAEAVKARQQGNVRFRLMVNKEGRVEHCRITGSSGSPVLDSATCRLVRARARFTPALDAKGKPAPDTFSAVIAWRLPGSQLPPRP